MSTYLSAHRRSAKPDGITIYPIERLGNQLFVYAAGLAQARRLGGPLYANLGFYRHLRPKRTYEKTYALTGFDSGVVIPNEPRYHGAVVLGLPSVKPAAMWHAHVSPLISPPLRPIFMERSFAYDHRINNVVTGTTVIGLFQSWKYFSDVQDEITRRMTSLTQPSEWYLTMAQRIVPGRRSIVLNVRRGDYLLPEQQRVQGLATKQYYERALAHARQLGFDGELFLASDSLGPAHTELASIGRMTMIDPPSGTNPFEVLAAISRADLLVAANSSFSWWAGFLGRAHGNTVIVPRPWFTKGSVPTQDLHFDDWISLGRD